MQLPFRLALPILACLAACTSPQEQCLTSANSALAALDAQIATAQGNLQRGYAINQVQRNVPQAASCSNARRSDTISTANSMCLVNNVQTVNVPVQINLAAEQQRLNALIARRPTVAQQAAEASATCRAAYPL